MRCIDDNARCDNAAVLLTIDVLMENWLLHEGEEADELGGPDVHRGRIRDVDDGEKCKNDDDDDGEDELQRLADDDARRRIIPALADAAELIQNLCEE